MSTWRDSRKPGIQFVSGNEHNHSGPGPIRKQQDGMKKVCSFQMVLFTLFSLNVKYLSDRDDR